MAVASKLRYILEENNLLSKSYATLTARATTGTLDSAFEVENVAALPVSHPFIVRGSGGSVASRIIIDFSGQGRDCTMVGVAGNFSDQATASLHYGSNSDPNGKFGDLHINRGVAFLVFSEVGSTTLNSEHFAIRINDDVDTGVYGYAILATHEETPAGLAQMWTQSVNKKIRAVQNELGVPMIGRKVTEAYETSVSFEGMTEHERLELDAWLHALGRPDQSAVHGRTRPQRSAVRSAGLERITTGSLQGIRGSAITTSRGRLTFRSDPLKGESTGRL